METWLVSLKGSLTSSFRSFLSAAQVLSEERLATVDTTNTTQRMLFTQAKSASFCRVSKLSSVKFRIQASKRVIVADLEQVALAPQASASQVSEGPLGETQTAEATLATFNQVSRLGKPRLRTPSTSSLF